jgi:hypothetical protein
LVADEGGEEIPVRVGRTRHVETHFVDGGFQTRPAPYHAGSMWRIVHANTHGTAQRIEASFPGAPRARSDLHARDHVNGRDR